jgi:hypothetical protein
VGVGLDNLDLAALRAAGVAVSWAPGSNAASVAEYVMGALLHLWRRFDGATDHVRGGGWDRPAFMGHEAFGRTLGVVGLGDIGARVARRARAFGLDVVASDPVLHDASFAVQELGRAAAAARPELLARSDAVTLHVPLVPSTRGMIDADALRRMRPGALLVNTSRGGLVDEAALARRAARRPPGRRRARRPRARAAGGRRPARRRAAAAADAARRRHHGRVQHARLAARRRRGPAGARGEPLRTPVGYAAPARRRRPLVEPSSPDRDASPERSAASTARHSSTAARPSSAVAGTGVPWRTAATKARVWCTTSCAWPVACGTPWSSSPPAWCSTRRTHGSGSRSIAPCHSAVQRRLAADELEVDLVASPGDRARDQRPAVAAVGGRVEAQAHVEVLEPARVLRARRRPGEHLARLAEVPARQVEVVDGLLQHARAEPRGVGLPAAGAARCGRRHRSSFRCSGSPSRPVDQRRTRANSANTRISCPTATTRSLARAASASARRRRA